MTTASVLLTVGTTLGNITEKHGKEKENAGSLNVTEIAARELRETPNTREQTLRIMREWIQKNNDIRNVRQGNDLSSMTILLNLQTKETQRNHLTKGYFRK